LPDVGQCGSAPQVQRAREQFGDRLRISPFRRLAPCPREEAEFFDIGTTFELIPKMSSAEELASDTLTRCIQRQAGTQMEDVGLERSNRTARRAIAPQLLDERGNRDDPPGVQREQCEDLALLGRARRDIAGPQGCGQRS